MSDEGRPEGLSEEEKRIRAAVGHWGLAGESGTYKADEVDYGKIDIAILRDSRFLIATIDALRERVELAEAGQGKCQEIIVGLESALAAEREKNRKLREALTAEVAYRRARSRFAGGASKEWVELERAHTALADQPEGEPNV